MSYPVDFYRVNADPRTLNKYLSSQIIATQSVDFKLGRDKMRPVIELRYDPATEAVYKQIDQVNYIRLDTGNSNERFKYRYYFVNNVIVKPTGIFRLECTLDVLMTYKSFITELVVTLDRSETVFNGYLPDSEYTALGYRSIVAAKFPNGLTTDSYILMTTG